MRVLVLAIFAFLAVLASANSTFAATFDPPKLTRFVKATPPDSLKEGEPVEVILGIDIDDKGKVIAVVIEQTGGEAFDKAAVDAARQFEFEPGRADGKPVPVHIRYSYKFLYEAPPAPSPAPDAAPPQPDTVPFSGTILKKGDRTPIPGALVVLDEGLESRSDDAGRFRFDAVSLGPHKVRIRGKDIAASETSETFVKGIQRDVKYYVDVRDRYTAIVRARSVVKETVETVLDGAELRRIPGTQGDTLKAVQNLPGVARAPFGGGQLVVWGSAPGDTRVYVDGVYIPTLYHFGGLRSTVNSEMVQSLAFRPGGFGVEYGRGLGGVIDVESRRPRTDGYHGFVQLDLIDLSLMVEGKISKNVSFAVAARRSHIDVFLPLFSTNDFQLSPVYYDYQAKLYWRATPKDDVDLFIFGSDDTIKLALKNSDPTLSAAFDSHTYYHRALVRWTHRFSKNLTLTLTPSVGYDVPFQIKGNVGSTPIGVDARTFEYSVRGVLRAQLASFLRVDVGVDFEGNRLSLAATTPAAGQPREGDPPAMMIGGAFVSESATTLTNHTAPFVALNFSFFKKRLLLSPQLRLDVMTFTGYRGTPDEYARSVVSVEPRFTFRAELHKMVSLKGAIGVYRQPQDPSSFLRVFGNPTGVVPQFGMHYVLGVEVRPIPSLTIELDGFYKDLRQLIVRGKDAGDPSVYNDGLGRVYGAQLLVRQELFKNFFGWISYTASRSERQEHPGEPWRLFQFDQTHIFTLIASYKLPRGYQIGIRFRYVTGNPQTPVIGAYNDLNQDEYQPRYGRTLSSRLTDFHQLDLRFDKTWKFKRWALAMYLDIQNLYYSKPAEGTAYNFDFSQMQPIAGLPFLPVLGFRGEF